MLCSFMVCINLVLFVEISVVFLVGRLNKREEEMKEEACLALWRSLQPLMTSWW